MGNLTAYPPKPLKSLVTPMIVDLGVPRSIRGGGTTFSGAFSVSDREHETN